MEIQTEEDAWAACTKLHERGPGTVVITSVSLPSVPDELMLLCSTGTQRNSSEIFTRTHVLRQKIQLCTRVAAFCHYNRNANNVEFLKRNQCSTRVMQTHTHTHLTTFATNKQCCLRSRRNQTSSGSGSQRWTCTLLEPVTCSRHFYW